MPVDPSKFSKEHIQEVLLRPDDVGMHAVGRALVLLNKRQTYSERMAKEVNRNNGKGFTPTDAGMGTDMANFYAARGFLTERQLGWWRKPNAQNIPRICKYWKQLQEDALAKHGLNQLPKASKKKDSEQPLFTD
jgi:hypothetical protein